jgi:hypothetical protein
MRPKRKRRCELSGEPRARFNPLKALNALRDARSYSKAEKLVLVMVVSHTDRYGTSYPSLDTLAVECAMARSVVATAVANLLKRTDGPVQITASHQGRRDGSGGRGPNRYQLRLSPAGGRKVAAVESGGRTEVDGDLSPKSGGVESEKRGLESDRRTGRYPEEEIQRKGTRDLARSKSAPTPAPAVLKLTNPKPAKAKAPADPNVTVLRDWHRSEHLRLRGAEPKYTSSQHAAAGKAWKDLLSVRTVVEGKQIITAGLTEGFAVDPWLIVKQQNKLATGNAGTGRGRYQPQAITPELSGLGRAAGAGLLGHAMQSAQEMLTAAVASGET